MHAQRIGTTRMVETALVLAEETFGVLDLGEATVRSELAHVDWESSVGVFTSNGTCVAQLLVSPVHLADYVRDNGCKLGFDADALSQLTCLRGDSLIILPEAKRHAVRMWHMITGTTDVDLLWGTAHADLDNMGFWGRHATILGDAPVADEGWFFGIPLNERARLAVHEAVHAPQANTSPRP